MTDKVFEHYPDPAAVDVWLEGIWQEAQQTACEAELLPEQGFVPRLGLYHMRGYGYVRFSPQGRDPFYGYWQPAPSQPAPLLVHTPGYNAEISVHPDLVAQGYNVLHVNPLGYVTSSGPDEAKKREGTWPVFEDTLASGAHQGYRQWLVDCALAVRWAWGRREVLADRVSFFGTSQGGGASLLLGSLYQGRGVRCVAADEPWMVHFSMAQALQLEWSQALFERIASLEDPLAAWHALGMIDALSHARRLTVPVLLTAGGADATCPPATIESLFDELPATKVYCYLQGQAHGYTQEFITLAAAWFRLYA